MGHSMGVSFMRLILAAALAISTAVPATASTVVDLPLNGAVTLIGDIPSPVQLFYHMIFSFSPPADTDYAYVVTAQVTTGLGDPGFTYLNDFRCVAFQCSGTKHAFLSAPIQVSDEFRTLIVYTYPQFSLYLPYSLELQLTLPDGITATPEPSTWAMMLIGFAALGFASWRRRAYCLDTK